MSIKDCTDSCSHLLSAFLPHLKDSGSDDVWENTCTIPQSRMWQRKEDEDNSADVTDRSASIEPSDMDAAPGQKFLNLWKVLLIRVG